MPLKKHQPFGLEGGNNPGESTEDGLFLFENQLGHHHHEVFVKSCSECSTVFGGVSDDSLVDLAEDHEGLRIDSVLKGVFQLFLFGNKGAINILGLDFIKEGLKGGKGLQRFSINDLCSLVEKILRVPQETGHQGQLLRDVLVLGECLNYLLGKDLHKIEGLAVPFAQHHEEKELVKGQNLHLCL